MQFSRKSCTLFRCGATPLISMGGSVGSGVSVSSPVVVACVVLASFVVFCLVVGGCVVGGAKEAVVALVVGAFVVITF